YFGNIAPPRHPVLSAENLKGLSRRQSGGGVAAQHFEEEFGLERMGHRWSVAELGCAAVHRLDQFARAFDLAQLPHRYGEPGHRNQAGVLAEAFARLPHERRGELARRLQLALYEREGPLTVCGREAFGKVAGDRCELGRAREGV